MKMPIAYDALPAEEVIEAAMMASGPAGPVGLVATDVDLDAAEAAPDELAAARNQRKQNQRRLSETKRPKHNLSGKL